jgi:hypothetical protein
MGTQPGGFEQRQVRTTHSPLVKNNVERHRWALWFWGQGGCLWRGGLAKLVRGSSSPTQAWDCILAYLGILYQVSTWSLLPFVTL